MPTKTTRTSTRKPARTTRKATYSDDVATLLKTHGRAFQRDARTMVATSNMILRLAPDAHVIAYAAMGVPPGADRTKTDAIKVSDTPWFKYPEALTSNINAQIDSVGLPPKKHVTFPAIQKCLSKTIGTVVSAVGAAIAR